MFAFVHQSDKQINLSVRCHILTIRLVYLLFENKSLIYGCGGKVVYIWLCLFPCSVGVSSEALGND